MIIELVVVIAVIGVLAAVLLPGFRHAVDRANAVKLAMGLKNG